MPQIPDPNAEPVHTCADCRRAFSARYGRTVIVAGVARWLCHFCGDVRRDRRSTS
jgi:transposase-like protein